MKFFSLCTSEKQFTSAMAQPFRSHVDVRRIDVDPSDLIDIGMQVVPSHQRWFCFCLTGPEYNQKSNEYCFSFIRAFSTEQQARAYAQSMHGNGFTDLTVFVAKAGQFILVTPVPSPNHLRGRDPQTFTIDVLTTMLSHYKADKNNRVERVEKRKDDKPTWRNDVFREKLDEFRKARVVNGQFIMPDGSLFDPSMFASTESKTDEMDQEEFMDLVSERVSNAHEQKEKKKEKIRETPSDFDYDAARFVKVDKPPNGRVLTNPSTSIRRFTDPSQQNALLVVLNRCGVVAFAFYGAYKDDQQCENAAKDIHDAEVDMFDLRQVQAGDMGALIEFRDNMNTNASYVSSDKLQKLIQGQRDGARRAERELYKRIAAASDFGRYANGMNQSFGYTPVPGTRAFELYKERVRNKYEQKARMELNRKAASTTNRAVAQRRRTNKNRKRAPKKAVQLREAKHPEIDRTGLPSDAKPVPFKIKGLEAARKALKPEVYQKYKQLEKEHIKQTEQRANMFPLTGMKRSENKTAMDDTGE